MKSEWEKAVEYHGHECPGLAIGIKMCEAVRSKFGISDYDKEDIVCIAEIDACSVDSIRVIMGCTKEKGNLIIEETGQRNFNFFNKRTGEKIRIFDDKKKTDMSRDEQVEYILSSSTEDLFEFSEPEISLPQ